MPSLPETEQGDALNPHWIAFWEIVRQEARSLDVLEESLAASSDKP